MTVIGISGKARTGKGEFAEVGRTTFGIKEISFGSSVKIECMDLLKSINAPYTIENFYGTNEQKEEWIDLVDENLRIIRRDHPDFLRILFTKGQMSGCLCGKHSPTHVKFTYRSLMQWWGTEYRRAQDYNYWVKKTLDFCVGNEVYIVSDLRFKNEAQGIRDAGGYLIRVERPGRPQISNADHPSEIDLDDWEDWDQVMLNAGTVDQYQMDCKGIINAIILHEKVRRP